MMQGCLKILGVIALMALAAGVAIWLALSYAKDRFVSGPDPVTIASASLQGLQEQNRLQTFAARYVAIVTSSQTRFGVLEAKKTLIMPGTVNYVVDLAKLGQRDVRWDEASRTLSVRLPEVQVVGPTVDFANIREYDNNGVLLRVTDAEARLDAANRREGQRELIRQAREATPMRLAREASRRAVERSFAMPLKAVGVDAQVRVLFPNEIASNDNERWDVSRSIEEVLNERANPPKKK